MKSCYRILLGLIAVVVGFPCDIDTTPLFVPVRVPEAVSASFVNGRIGLIVPTLSPRYKLIAWRHLSGLSIEQPQRDAIVKPEGSIAASPAEQWLSARRSFGGSQDMYFQTEKRSRLHLDVYYEACLPDAFSTAVKTLHDRQISYSDPALVKSWVAAQDKVFENCHSDTPSYPDNPDSTLNPLARADRQYQIAAAHFYAEDFAAAEQLFSAIAKDAASPWRDTAAYMIGRTLIRKYSLAGGAEALDPARKQLAAISSGPFRNSAQGLVRHIDSLQDPGAALKFLGDSLRGADFLTPWRGSTYVLTSARFQAVLTEGPLPEPFEWIQSLEPSKTGIALKHWRDTHSSLWLTSAIINASGSAPDAAELIDAAAKIPRDSPAYDTVTYHSMRLLIEAGKRDEARHRLDTLLARHADLASFDNALRALRMPLATSYDDLLHWAPRIPIGTAGDDFDLNVPSIGNDAHASSDRKPTEPSGILDRDAADILGYSTPLNQLAVAAESSRLPSGVRSELAIVVWTRAFILSDDEMANRAASLILRTHPKWSAEINAFRNANGNAKRFAGALLIEKHDEITPTVWSDFRSPVPNDFSSPQWWCSEPGAPKIVSHPLDSTISEEDQAKAATEVRQTTASGATQFFLAPIVMSWAGTHPDDPRLPEALGRLVGITRYGCRGVNGNGAISKAAFDLLHKRYPGSAWTKQTPYWFDK